MSRMGNGKRKGIVRVKGVVFSSLTDEDEQLAEEMLQELNAVKEAARKGKTVLEVSSDEAWARKYSYTPQRVQWAFRTCSFIVEEDRQYRAQCLKRQEVAAKAEQSRRRLLSLLSCRS